MRVCLISAVILVMSLMQGASAKSDEDRLVAKLLEDLLPVGRIARPVSSASDNVTVTLQMTLLRIASLKGNIVKLDLWLHMGWKDPRLTWRPADYSDLSYVVLPADLLWLPDIRPFNSIEYEPSKAFTDRVVLYPEGDVSYALPVSITSSCYVFENRSVSCTIKLGSWAYDGAQVDLMLTESNAIYLDFYQHDEAWDLKGSSAIVQRESDDCCPDLYIAVMYRLRFEPRDRKSSDSRRSKKSVSTRSNRHVI